MGPTHHYNYFYDYDYHNHNKSEASKRITGHPPVQRGQKRASYPQAASKAAGPYGLWWARVAVLCHIRRWPPMPTLRVPT
jgi:hypothetical protein